MRSYDGEAGIAAGCGRRKPRGLALPLLATQSDWRWREGVPMSRYYEVYERWKRDPQAFWAAAAADIDWYEGWREVFARVDGLDRWFVGGRCNTCWNALDRHVERGRADQPALIYDSPVTGTKKTFTYRQLRDEVATFAAVLEDLGVRKGDRVILYMPMIPEALIGMLACARIGAIHSVVFGGFAADELATRINDAKPKVIVSASCGIEVNRVIPYKPMLDKAIDSAKHKPEHCIILQRPQTEAQLISERDIEWSDALAHAEPAACVPVAA